MNDAFHHTCIHGLRIANAPRGPMHLDLTPEPTSQQQLAQTLGTHMASTTSAMLSGLEQMSQQTRTSLQELVHVQGQQQNQAVQLILSEMNQQALRMQQGFLHALAQRPGVPHQHPPPPPHPASLAAHAAAANAATAATPASSSSAPNAAAHAAHAAANAAATNWPPGPQTWAEQAGMTPAEWEAWVRSATQPPNWDHKDACVTHDDMMA